MGLLSRLFRKKEKKQSVCAAVIVAAGSATRMEGADKILSPLGGMPVLMHTLRPFEESGMIQEIIVVTRQEILVEVLKLCKEYGYTKVRKILPGGASRMASVQIGLGEIGAGIDLAAIHDGARPFVTREVIEEAVLQAAATGAAAPGIPVRDTIKEVELGLVQKTLPRSNLWAIQTPQVFEASLIKGALDKAIRDGVELSDDCAAVERIGFAVSVTQGSEENWKLTTPGDLLLGEAVLAGRGPF